MGLVSIIVPVYRAEKNLDICIRSIVEQTYRDIEIILVDDGSPDRCGEICDEWVKKDKRIKVVHQINQGASVARNSGLKIATGKYVCFVDSDDLVKPDYVQHMLEPMETKNFGLVVCKFYRMYADRVVKCDNIVGQLKGNFWYDFPLIRDFLCGPFCKLYLKKIIDDNNICFPEGISLGEDQAFTFTYYKYISNYWFINEELYQYNCGDINSLTHRNTRYVDTAAFAFVYDLIRNKMKEAGVKNHGEIANFYIIANIIPKFYQDNDYLERVKQIDLLRSKLDFNHSVTSLKYKIVIWLVRYRIYFPLFAYGWLKRKMSRGN